MRLRQCFQDAAIYRRAGKRLNLKFIVFFVVSKKALDIGQVHDGCNRIVLHPPGFGAFLTAADKECDRVAPNPRAIPSRYCPQKQDGKGEESDDFLSR